MQTITTSDELNLHMRHWPVDRPNAAILLVHGLAEHIERYTHVAKALNAAHYAVVGVDLRTHGRSEGTPRAYATDLEIFVDDLKPAWDLMRKSYPEAPLFIMGHSMGGHIAVRFALRYGEQIQGIITSGVGLMPPPQVPLFLLPLLKLLAKLVPTLKISTIDPDLLTHDAQITASRANDPLVYHGRVRIGILAAIFTVPPLETLGLPLLSLHGEADQIIRPQASTLLVEQAKTNDKTLKIYPGLYHEILNEPQRETILQDVIEWLDAHLGA